MARLATKAGRTALLAESNVSIRCGAGGLQTRSFVAQVLSGKQRGFGDVGRSGSSLRTPTSLQVCSRRSLTTASGTGRNGGVRQASTNASPNPRYEAIVVGGGPAGISAVGNLLEQKVAPVLWVDPVFEAGRVNRSYREVPSNTKVRLFIEFATATAPFRGIVSGKGSKEGDGVSKEALGKGDRLDFLRNLEQEQGCELGIGADMLHLLSDGLREDPAVDAQHGRVADATLNDTASTPTWTVRLSKDEHSGAVPTILSAESPRLIFCTGSSPNNSALPVAIPGIADLDLDCALSPTLLATTFARQTSTPTTIAVIGASHSAILVLRNLYRLAKTQNPHLRVKWFTRHPIRYAVPQPDGWVLRENTGLKGEAATWARDSLEPDTMPHSDVGNYISKVAYEKGDEEAVFKQHLPGCDWYVQAIGYDRDPLPPLRMAGSGKEVLPVFDHDSGVFKSGTGQGEGQTDVKALQRLPGLFGSGIAFPERVVDPHGNVELNVGFWKFMKAAKKWVEVWK
ncbi:hypothetical protein MBLNU230_g6754t1 [Neophaeotheca triangularis]